MSYIGYIEGLADIQAMAAERHARERVRLALDASADECARAQASFAEAMSAPGARASAGASFATRTLCERLRDAYRVATGRATVRA